MKVVSFLVFKYSLKKGFKKIYLKTTFFKYFQFFSGKNNTGKK